MSHTVTEHFHHYVTREDTLDGGPDCLNCGYPFNVGDIALSTDDEGVDLYCGCGCLPRHDGGVPDDADTDAPSGWESVGTDCPDDADTDAPSGWESVGTDCPDDADTYTIRIGLHTAQHEPIPIIQPVREATIWQNARAQGLTVNHSRGRYFVPMPDRVADGIVEPRPRYAIRTLLTRDTASPKLAKSIGAVDAEIRGRILYLAPARSAGIGNICEHHGACVKDCLGPHSGRGRMHKTQWARIARTRFLAADRTAFCGQLLSELDTFESTCTRLNAIAGIRLDGTSDLDWRSICPEAYHNVFILPRTCDWVNYGYTKNLGKYHESRLCLDTTISGQYPTWYLTFSRDVHNDTDAHNVVAEGGNSAIVVRTKAMLQQLLQTGYRGYPCIDGDIHDWRFLDAPGHYVVLSAKGKAKRSTTGFVLDV